MYSVYPKDGLLLHLGQEQGIGKVISSEYIFITNTLTAWSISKKLDSHFFFPDWVCICLMRECCLRSGLQSGFLWVLAEDSFMFLFRMSSPWSFAVTISSVAVSSSCLLLGHLCCAMQCYKVVLLLMLFFFPTKKDINDSLKAKALILAKFALR